MTKVTGHPPLGRRFNLVDLAILVLAMAVGLAATRKDNEGIFIWSNNFPIIVNNYRIWINPFILVKAVYMETWLMALSAGWLVLQLRQPRPRLRQLSRQPGFLACFSSVVITLASGPLIWILINPNSNPVNGWNARMIWGEMVSSQIGAAVLAGWSLLVAGGRYRIRTGWLDRVGQLLGLIWVVMIPVNLFTLIMDSLPEGGWTN